MSYYKAIFNNVTVAAAALSSDNTFAIVTEQNGTLYPTFEEGVSAHPEWVFEKVEEPEYMELKGQFEALWQGNAAADAPSTSEGCATAAPSEAPLYGGCAGGSEKSDHDGHTNSAPADEAQAA